MNKKLKSEVWEKGKYWDLAQEGSSDTDHPGMKLLFKVARKRDEILDIGCGEGTRLSLVGGRGKKLTGIDISSYAINKARAKFPGINFISGNVESLPFRDKSFDLVYSAFVFEHLDDPERVLKEVVRVLKVRGNLLLIAPNYGAPNRASPSFRGSRLKKLAFGFIEDVFQTKFKGNVLGWRKVNPIANAKHYEMDWDTTVEPYIGGLIPFLSNLGMKVDEAMSCWEKEQPGAGITQKVFRFLGEHRVYPFTNWGPHLVLLVTKC